MHMTDNECLAQAMFLAAESYSGSMYGIEALMEIDDICADVSVALPGYETDIIVAVAA